MIKDIIINLEHQVVRDPARDFAISIAEICDTHLAGVAFAYTPEFPGYVVLELPPDIVAQMTAESETTNATSRANESRRGREKQVSVQNGAVTTMFASFGS